MWQNPDVHARTPEVQSVIKSEYERLVPRSIEMLPHFQCAKVDILAAFPGDQQIKACLDKMEARKQVIDRDTFGMSPAGLLAATWYDMVVPYGGQDHFKNTVYDMGLTCVQGDTHRLILTYVALDRSVKPS